MKKTISPQLREEAVRLVVEIGHSAEFVSEKLDIPILALKTWLNEYLSEEMHDLEHLNFLLSEIQRIKARVKSMEESVSAYYKLAKAVEDYDESSQ